MQVLLSEQEYENLKNRSERDNNYIDSAIKMKNDLKRAFQVTAKGYEKNKVEVVDIKLDVTDLIEIIIKNCFDDREKKSIDKYIDNGNRVKLSNVKMNELDTDVFLNNVIDKIRKGQLSL